MKQGWIGLRPRLGWVFFLAFVAVSPGAAADDLAAKGRSILETHRNAVITVKLVLKEQWAFSGIPARDNESKTEATGTVIDPSGLTVISLSVTDPSSIFASMLESFGGMGDIKMDTDVGDVKMLLRDGSEISAEIVLRDKDLDLAFVRPEKKQEKAFEFIDLSAGATPEILDQVFSINRLGRVAARVHSISVGRVNAIVKKPRTFFVMAGDPTRTNLGSPAFTLGGKVIGVSLLRTIKNTGGSSGGFFSGMGDNMIFMILPGEDVLDAASQAPPYKD